MIEVFTAKSGAPSLRIDGIALHSPYDPAREAERFVAESIGGESPSTIVVLGEGLGYAAASAETRHPHARVIRVIYSREVFRAGHGDSGIAWSPGGELGLAEFLRRQIGELDLEGLRIIEWPPSVRLFPSQSRSANEAVRQVVQELNGSFVTTLSAGRLWIRNGIANFLALESTLVGELCAPERPVILAASGPTLENALPLIARVRPLVDLWALPSSCPALQCAGLSPDLIVLTDPGFYAMHHLRFAAAGCPLAMPLSAARGSWCLPRGARTESGASSFLLGQPGFFEHALLQSLGVSAPLIAPHGTVAATALDLALVCTRAPVILAGLDMCSRDLALHARPGAFDLLLHLASGRLTPHHSLAFQRSESLLMQKVPGTDGARASLSLRTYAGWLAESIHATSGRIFRLLPSPIRLDGMKELNAASLASVLGNATGEAGGPRLREHSGLPRGDQRRRILTGLLSRWMEELETARTTAAGPDGPAALGRSPSVLSMAYYIEPQLLIETRRKARHGDAAGARATAGEMLEGCAHFLRSLRTRIADVA
jgi:hypothetical protein